MCQIKPKIADHRIKVNKFIKRIYSLSPHGSLILYLLLTNRNKLEPLLELI